MSKRTPPLIQPESDAVVVLIELVQSVDARMGEGFERVEKQIAEMAASRARCTKEHNDRMTALEHWRSWVLGVCAVVSLVVLVASSAISSEFEAWRKIGRSGIHGVKP